MRSKALGSAVLMGLLLTTSPLSAEDPGGGMVIGGPAGGSILPGAEGGMVIGGPLGGSILPGQGGGMAVGGRLGGSILPPAD